MVKQNIWYDKYLVTRAGMGYRWKSHNGPIPWLYLNIHLPLMPSANSYIIRLYYIFIFDDCQHHLMKLFLHTLNCNIVPLSSNSHLWELSYQQWWSHNTRIRIIKGVTSQIYGNKLCSGTCCLVSIDIWLVKVFISDRLNCTLWLHNPLYISKNCLWNFPWVSREWGVMTLNPNL